MWVTCLPQPAIVMSYESHPHPFDFLALVTRQLECSGKALDQVRFPKLSLHDNLSRKQKHRHPQAIRPLEISRLIDVDDQRSRAVKQQHFLSLLAEVAAQPRIEHNFHVFCTIQTKDRIILFLLI